MKKFFSEAFPAIIGIPGCFLALTAAACFTIAIIGSAFPAMDYAFERFCATAKSYPFPQNYIFCGTVVGWLGCALIFIACIPEEFIKPEPEKPKQEGDNCGRTVDPLKPILGSAYQVGARPIRLPVKIRCLPGYKAELLDANDQLLGAWHGSAIDNVRLVARNLNRYDALVAAVEEMLPIVEAHEKLTAKKSSKKSKTPHCASFNLRKMKAMLAWAKIPPDQQYESN